MNPRGRRTQARADARRIANTRRELAEKRQREENHKIKKEGKKRRGQDAG